MLSEILVNYISRRAVWTHVKSHASKHLLILVVSNANTVIRAYPWQSSAQRALWARMKGALCALCNSGKRALCALCVPAKNA